MMQEKYAFVCVLKNPASGPDGHDMFKTQGFRVFKAELPRTGMEIEFIFDNAWSRKPASENSYHEYDGTSEIHHTNTESSRFSKSRSGVYNQSDLLAIESSKSPVHNIKLIEAQEPGT